MRSKYALSRIHFLRWARLTPQWMLQKHSNYRHLHNYSPKQCALYLRASQIRSSMTIMHRWTVATVIVNNRWLLVDRVPKTVASDGYTGNGQTKTHFKSNDQVIYRVALPFLSEFVGIENNERMRNGRKWNPIFRVKLWNASKLYFLPSDVTRTILYTIYFLF